MSWDADTTELRVRKVEKALEDFREIVETDVASPVNLGGDIGGSQPTGSRALGPIQYPFIFNPIDHRRFDTEAPPGGGADVFNTIFIRSTSVIVTPKVAESPIQIRTLADPIHDGQIMFLTVTTAGLLDLLAPTTEGNVNISSDVTGLTDDDVLILQWQENSPIPTSSAGSWVIIGGTSGGTGNPNEVVDNVFRIIDDIDSTRKLAFQVGGIAGSTTRTWTAQDIDGVVAMLNGGADQVFSNNIRLASANLELNGNFISSTTSAITTDAGKYRLTNNEIALAWRTAAGDGNVEIKVDTLDFLDITDSSNGPVTIQLRAQDAVVADKTGQITQNNGATGSLDINTGTEIDLQIAATDIIQIFTNGVNFLQPIDLGGNQIQDFSCLVFDGFGSGTGKSICRATGELHYDMEGSADKHLFRVDGTPTPANAFHISASEIQLYSPLDFVPSADGTLNIGSDTFSFNDINADRLILRHNNGVLAASPSIGRSSNALRLNSPTGNAVEVDINAVNEYFFNSLGFNLRNLNSIIFLDSSDNQDIQISYLDPVLLIKNNSSLGGVTIDQDAVIPSLMLKGNNSTDGLLAHEILFQGFNSGGSLTRDYASIKVRQIETGVGIEDAGMEFRLMESGTFDTAYLILNAQFEEVQIFKTLTMGGNDILNMGGETINDETEDISPDTSTDYVLTYDASVAALRKVRLDNLPTGAGAPDIIFEGDSSVEVIDVGSGVINTTIDGVLKGSWGSTQFTVFDDLRVSGQIEPSSDSVFTLGSSTLFWSILYADRWRMLSSGGDFAEIFATSSEMVFDVPSGDGFEWRINGAQVGSILSDGTWDFSNEDLEDIRNLTVNSTTNLNGDTFLNGNLTVIGNSIFDRVIFNAFIDSGLTPDNDNLYDLGTASLRWNDIRAAGQLRIDSGINASTMTGTLITTPVLQCDNAIITGDLDHGNGSNDNVGFYNTAPRSQQTAIFSGGTTASNTAAINTLVIILRDMGLVDT